MIFGRITKHFSFIKCVSHFNFIRPITIYDKNFEYFRNKKDYKNSVVQLNNLKECKLAGPEFPFLIKDKEQDITDGFFFYLKLAGPEFSFLIKDKEQDFTGDFSFHIMQRAHVMELTDEKLKDIMCLMANTKIDTTKYINILKYVDEKCAVSVERWPLDFSLYILDAWFIVLGSKASRKYYYSAVTSMWSRKMKRCSKSNSMLILYFIGMSKRPFPFLMELLEDKLENYSSDLTIEEWAIACLSFFKTSTKIKSNLLLKQFCKAAENLLVKNDRFNLISILKCLRLSRYFDADLMIKLAEYIKTEYESFNFTECTNFLACFTTQNIYSNDVYNCLEKQGITMLSQEDFTEFDKSIEKMHPSLRSRIKDLARFLWGMTFIGHNLQEKSITFIINLLNIRLDSGEFETNLPALIDCLQSLVFLGYYPQNLIEYVLTPEFLHKISFIEKAKPKYQLYFIYRSACIENSLTNMKNMKFFNHIPKDLQKDIKKRYGFQELINYLNIHLKEKYFTCCYIMPHIMIAGIVIVTKYKDVSWDNINHNAILKLIENGIISSNIGAMLSEDKFITCLEILDPTVCVSKSNEPLALMKTKLRQLKKLNINVITLTPEEINLFKYSKSLEHCSKIANLIS